jgi:hypothetical protein
MTFQIASLPDEMFRQWFELDEETVRQRGARRYTANERPGFPCRVSLEDAWPGDTVMLVPYAHLDADSPYRASGPVFVRAGARRAAPAPGEVPELLRLRLLSVRGYDRRSLMRAAEVVDGRDLERAIGRLFGDDRVAFLHVHFAGPGCYACRIDRAAEA